MPRKTDIRDRILAFIVSHQEEHGYSPTMREVASGVGVSSSGCVHRHITEMKEAGILQDRERHDRLFSVHRKKI